MTAEYDIRCDICKIPLRAVYFVTPEGRCADKEACEARRSLLEEHGTAHLLSPTGVTKMEADS